MSKLDDYNANKAANVALNNELTGKTKKKVVANGFSVNGNVEEVSQHIRAIIGRCADQLGVTACDLEAEILKQSLLSDECDRCHVHWFDLHAKLDKILKP